MNGVTDTMETEGGWHEDAEHCVEVNSKLVGWVINGKKHPKTKEKQGTDFREWAEQQDVPPGDLESAGVEGLVKACRGFDPGRGFQFSTYAVPVIERELRDCIQREGRDGQLLTDTQREGRNVVFAALSTLREELGGGNQLLKNSHLQRR